MTRSFATYANLRNALQDLEANFSRSSYAKLYHDRIMPPDYQRWDDGEFTAFSEANADHSVEQEWSLWPNRQSASRFFGFHIRYQRERFEQLADRACRILLSLQCCSKDGRAPDHFACELSSDWYKINGWFDWLDLLHEYGRRFATTKLATCLEYWGVSLQPVDAKQRQLIEETTAFSTSGVEVHLHPMAERLRQNVFEASAEVIRLMLEADSVIPLNYWDGPVLPVQCPPLKASPYWDESVGELWLGDQLVKRFEKAAPNQRCVLQVFEEEGWPTQIDDPIPPKGNIDPRQRIKDTVKELNDRHVSTGKIKFAERSSGEAIAWTRL